MRTVKPWITLLLPVALAASGCAEKKEGRVVAPTRPVAGPPAAAEAHWVWDRAALSAAVSRASSSPLVERTLAESPTSGLDPAFQNAIHLEGSLDNGQSVSLTLLPYVVGGDSTHAAFVSVARSGDLELAEFAEMIVGRDPSPFETGFHPALWGTTPVWVKTGDAYSVDAAGHLAPLRRSLTKLFECLVQEMPSGCMAGGIVGGAVGGPGGAAIGCGVGAAMGAAACVADWLFGG
ncbi:MAG TPA: hypothetical protein VF363_05685 [Candidatus Eisenbacteria bacterium]